LQGVQVRQAISAHWGRRLGIRGRGTDQNGNGSRRDEHRHRHKPLDLGLVAALHHVLVLLSGEDYHSSEIEW
jgi:hypothetical protein